MNEIQIENIVDLGNGIKYAYEKEGIFDTEFIAECNEYGEEFVTSFYAPFNTPSEHLKVIGNDMAMGWGAICYNVYRNTKQKLMK